MSFTRYVTPNFALETTASATILDQDIATYLNIQDFIHPWMKSIRNTRQPNFRGRPCILTYVVIVKYCYNLRGTWGSGR